MENIGQKRSSVKKNKLGSKMALENAFKKRECHYKSQILKFKIQNKL